MVTHQAESAKSFEVAVQMRARRNRTWLCVGLDPDPSRLPPGRPPTAAGISQFCRDIIEATVEHAVAFKLQFAFFEQFGAAGWEALAEVRAAIPLDVPVIADAKRGDIANTATAYARSILEVLDFTAVTISPYLGWDSVEPFVRYPGRAALVLCRTSNPGGGALQELVVGGEPLFLHVARGALALARPDGGEVGLVVGATRPEALRRVRALNESVLLLVPGVGAQGASAGQAIENGANAMGENALIAVSRDILYAANDETYARAAARKARELAQQTV